ncbi:MAG: hypothetical protein K0R39_3388 [Symbiobacteriaceae bacterium]|jgi:hypothetical protein|nr:hypothetical protein [Symbiobacteriaceae bacterium]
MVGGRRVRAPRWAEWQRAVAAVGAGPASLLAGLLRDCVDGVSAGDLDRLPAAEGDALLSAIFDLMETERAELDLAIGPLLDGAGALVTGRGVDLTLRPWSFGARNRALDQALVVDADGVRLDLPAFEMAMVLGCVASASGSLSPSDVAGWPVALGEAVVAALDELNGVAPGREQVVAACARQGVRHPDLDLVELCLAFGWTPAQVEGLTAQQAERLLGAGRALGGGLSGLSGLSHRAAGLGRWAAEPGAPGHGAAGQAGMVSAPGAGLGEVTRIVVTDR